MRTDDLAKGWAEGDVRLLEELAGLGMDLARSLTRQVLAHEKSFARGEAQPMGRADAARVSLDFSRFARAVRMTLALKARARGADAPAAGGGSGRSRDPFPNLDDPDDDFDDPHGDPAVRAAEVRQALDHALSWPGHGPAETERLREALEIRLERESEVERYPGSVNELVDLICRDLGLPCNWRAGLDETGLFHRWVVGRPDDPGDPLILPGGEPALELFMQRWTRPRRAAPVSSPDSPDDRSPVLAVPESTGPPRL